MEDRLYQLSHPHKIKSLLTYLLYSILSFGGLSVFVERSYLSNLGRRKH